MHLLHIHIQTGGRQCGNSIYLARSRFFFYGVQVQIRYQQKHHCNTERSSLMTHVQDAIKAKKTESIHYFTAKSQKKIWSFAHLPINLPSTARGNVLGLFTSLVEILHMEDLEWVGLSFMVDLVSSK